MIERLVACKKSILSRLYDEKIERPNRYFGSDDLSYLEEKAVLEASFRQLLELRYIEEHLKTKHYRITTKGALYCEEGING